MNSFWQDVRYSLRVIAKAPGFAAIVILTLALGIGANTTIFSWINATLLNPIPGLASPNEVVALSLGRPSDNPFPFTYPDFEMMRNGQHSFAGLTGCNPTPMSLTGKGKPERIWGTVASANYFDVLGVRPILGRGFMAAEDEKPGGAPVAVISYRLWQTHFGANPGVLGQTIEINQHPYTIVGVTPAVFQGSQTGIRSEIWVPIMMEAQLVPRNDLLHDHHYFWFVVLGRLKPGVEPKQAQEEMTLLLKREVKNYPEEHRGHDSVTVYPLWRSPFGANQFLSMLLPMLMIIAGLVLLLACANVANLMLVRSVIRRRETTIRMSLGASRWRLVRQVLVESLMLAIAGGVVALLITFWTAGTFMKFLPTTDFPISLGIRVDRAVLLATMVISVITGVIFGILPALRSSSTAPVTVLKEDTGSASGGLRKARLASGLVVAQMSLSLLLLICAGLFIRSFMRAQQINPGFNSHNVLIASYDLFTSGYSDAERGGIRSSTRRETGSAAGDTVGGAIEPRTAGIRWWLDQREARGLRTAGERIDGDSGRHRHAELFPDHADSDCEGTRLHASGHDEIPARGDRQRNICESLLAASGSSGQATELGLDARMVHGGRRGARQQGERPE